MNELKDLIPPRELCEEAAAVIGNETALVWMHRIALDGISEEPFLVTNRLIAEHYKREMYPAPTLAELLEMLLSMEDICKYPEVNRDCGTDWVVRVFVPGAMIHERDPKNPATAALRLLMRLEALK